MNVETLHYLILKNSSIAIKSITSQANQQKNAVLIEKALNNSQGLKISPNTLVLLPKIQLPKFCLKASCYKVVLVKNWSSAAQMRLYCSMLAEQIQRYESLRYKASRHRPFRSQIYTNKPEKLAHEKSQNYFSRFYRL